MAAISKDEEEKKKRGNFGDAAAAMSDPTVNQVARDRYEAELKSARDQAAAKLGAPVAGQNTSQAMASYQDLQQQANDLKPSWFAQRTPTSDARLAQAETEASNALKSVYTAQAGQVGAKPNQPASSALASIGGAPRPGNPDRLYQTPIDATAAPDGTPKAPEQSSNTVTYDPATKTYSGSNITEGFTLNGARNGGGNLSVFRGGAQAAMTAPEYQQGFIPAQVRHSGNDWEARNNLRNLDVAASSLTADAKDMMAYKNGLEADKALRETGARSLESQNRDAAFMDRTRAGENAANYRADIVNNIAQQRVNQEGVKLGFESDAAKQLQTLRNQIMTEKDDKKRSVLLDNYQTLTGKFQRPDAAARMTVVNRPDTMAADGVTVLKGGQTAFVQDANGSIREVPIGGQGQQVQQRAVGTVSDVGGKKAVWDGSKWIPQ